MKRTFLLLIFLGLTCCLAGNSWALIMNDFKFADGIDGKYLSEGESFTSDRHDLNHPDQLKYSLGAPYVDTYTEGEARFESGDTINWATLDLYLKDDNDSVGCLLNLFNFKQETASISVESEPLVSDVEVDSGTEYFFTKKYSYDLTRSMLDLLGNDGILNFTIACTQGDFILFKSVLTADITKQGPPDPPAPVPEPATLLLLGSGLMGLAGIRKKIK